jgi:pimeloyl-ACP methyl ester carboxylesterase
MQLLLIDGCKEFRKTYFSCSTRCVSQLQLNSWPVDTIQRILTTHCDSPGADKMTRAIWILLITVGLGATAGAGAWPWSPAQSPTPQSSPSDYRTYSVARSSSEIQPDPRPLVWVLDGAGDLKGSSTALTQANLLSGNLVELSVFPWSHGYRRLLMDQIDMNHARLQGAKLAQAILERKAREPGRRVVVIGHSAGCAVALAACDLLPIDAVDRVILLAPSVSPAHALVGKRGSRCLLQQKGLGRSWVCDSCRGNDRQILVGCGGRSIGIPTPRVNEIGGIGSKSIEAAFLESGGRLDRPHRRPPRHARARLYSGISAATHDWAVKSGSIDRRYQLCSVAFPNLLRYDRFY